MVIYAEPEFFLFIGGLSLHISLHHSNLFSDRQCLRAIKMIWSLLDPKGSALTVVTEAQQEKTRYICPDCHGLLLLLNLFPGFEGSLDTAVNWHWRNTYWGILCDWWQGGGEKRDGSPVEMSSCVPCYDSRTLLSVEARLNDVRGCNLFCQFGVGAEQEAVGRGAFVSCTGVDLTVDAVPGALQGMLHSCVRR